MAKWLTAYPGAFGLRDTLAPKDLDLEVFDASTHGEMFLITLTQRYRGLPLIGSDRRIILSGRGHHVRLVTGAVVDGRPDYANIEQQCPQEVAAESLRHYAVRTPGEAAAIKLSDFGLYAIAPSKTIVWGAHASYEGSDRGFLAVDATPIGVGGLPKLVYKQSAIRADLDDQVEITALGHDLDVAPLGPTENLPMKVNASLASGAPLMGSTIGDGYQLATPSVFVRDLGGGPLSADENPGTRVVSVNGQFLSVQDPALAAQRIYHLFQSFYDIAVPGDRCGKLRCRRKSIPQRFDSRNTRCMYG